MIISYSLFSGKPSPVHYDTFRMVENRYWLNIPTILEANKHYFPDSTTYIFVDSASTRHKYYPKLYKLFEEKKVKIIVCHLPNPMAWRIYPLWVFPNEVVFTRDLDSVMNSVEAECMREFLESDFTLHTIKSHPDHRDLFMLGGLSGFRKPLIRSSFREYLNFNGTDQDRLKSYFFGQAIYESNVIDYCFEPISNDLNREPNKTIKRETKYDEITTWPGQPVLSQTEWR